MNARFALLCCAIFGLLSGIAAGADTPPRSWADIADVWSKRAKTLPAVRVQCDEEEFCAAGTLYGKEGGLSTADIAKVDLTLARKAQFVVDRNRWRGESHGPVWANLFEKVLQCDKVMVFDGEKLPSYHFHEGEPSPNMRLGWIGGHKSACGWSRTPIWIPWMAMYHPLEECTALSDKNWEPTGELQRVERDGQTLLRQEFRSLAGRPRGLALVVDPARNCVLRRYEWGGSRQWKSNMTNIRRTDGFRESGTASA